MRDVQTSAGLNPSRGEARVLYTLRSGTRALHQAVEARRPMSRLLADDLSRADYMACLARLAALHATIEPALAPWLAGRVDLDLARRSKRAWLEDDLDCLGARPARPYPRPVWTTEAHAWGALYVLEGATLGGAVIARHVQHQPWLAQGRGLRFFRGYQRDTGPMWARFRAALADAAGDDDAFIAAALGSARATFRMLL